MKGLMYCTYARIFRSIKISPRRSKQALLLVKIGFYARLHIQEMAKPGGVLERQVGGESFRVKWAP